MNTAICLILVTVTVHLTSESGSTSITEAPTSVNASLNSSVEFKCVTTGVTLFWAVNGEYGLEDNITYVVFPTPGHLEGILYVPASVKYNNTEIVCQVFTANFTHEFSEPASLLVQGLLDPPSTLTVKNTSSSAIKLTWTPPFTLDITDVDPDISNYTVYITNTNTSNTGTVSVTELDGNGVVETEYTFTGLPGEDPDPCHVYQFSVSAWNVVGEGERSGPVEGWFLGAPLTITDLTIEMSLLSAMKPEINSFLTVNISCPGRLPDELEYKVVGTAEQSFTHPMSSIEPDGSLECSISDNVLIDVNSKYSVEVTAENAVDRSLRPAVRNFSTFDVQTAVIVTTSDTIVVTCFFAEDSQAKGCRVNALSQEGNTCNMIIDKGSGPQAKGRFELPDGTYEILVYDIEADGSLSENPAYQHNETVVVQGSSVSECKVSDDKEIDSEEESGGNKNAQPTIAIIAGSLCAVIVIVTVGIAAALLIYKRKRKKVKAVEPNLYGSSPASVPDGPPPAPSCSSSISSEENIAHSYHPLEEPYDYTSTNRTHVDYQNCANPQDSSVSHHSGPPQPGGTSKPPSEPEGGPPPAIPPSVPSHYQNSQNLADPQEKCVTNPQHEQPARAHYIQVDLTHPPHHHIPCHGTSDVTYSQIAHTEPASYRDSPRVGKRRQHTGHEVDHGTNKTGSHFH